MNDLNQFICLLPFVLLVDLPFVLQLVLPFALDSDCFLTSVSNMLFVINCKLISSISLLFHLYFVVHGLNVVYHDYLIIPFYKSLI